MPVRPAAALERKVKSLASNPPPRRDDYGWGGGWNGWGWGPPPRERRRGRRNYDYNNDFFSGIFGN